MTRCCHTTGLPALEFTYQIGVISLTSSAAALQPATHVPPPLEGCTGSAVENGWEAFGQVRVTNPASAGTRRRHQANYTELGEEEHEVFPATFVTLGGLCGRGAAFVDGIVHAFDVLGIVCDTKVADDNPSSQECHSPSIPFPNDIDISPPRSDFALISLNNAAAL